MTTETITAKHDLTRAERELDAIAERTRVGQRLEADDASVAVLERVVRQSRRVLEAELEAPAAPIILVTTGHPTLHQHPGTAGEDVHPRLGRLIQPRHTSSIELTAAAGIPWAADNDCFQGLDEARFVRMLDRIAGLPGCLFATVPDVVGDAAATLALFDQWAPELERRGIPAGYVLQDGATIESTPWARIAAVFVGGSDDFKLGPQAADLAREAKRRGKWVHWGRVNTRKRFDLIVATGAADSFDGSKWARWRKTYLPTALGWLEEAAQARRVALELGVTPAQAEAARAFAGLMRRPRTVVVEGRELLAVAGGSPELDELDAVRRQAAELVVLEAFDFNRGIRGHDYGGGQRRTELRRRAWALGGGVREAYYVSTAGAVYCVEGAPDGIVKLEATDLAAAARRVLAPRLRRIEREDYRRHTPASRRTREALEETLGYWAPTFADPIVAGEPELEVSDEEALDARRYRRLLEERTAGS